MKVFVHDYQGSAIARLMPILQSGRRVVMVAPTGSGKTVMAGRIAANFNRVLFVAHRIEITDQARAEMPPHVLVMSVGAALRYGPRNVDLLIIDEAHRAKAATYQAIIRKYRGCSVLGMTATPRRTDGKGLVDVFDEIVECASMRDLIERGYLAPYRAFEAPDAALAEFERMKLRNGDFEQSAASEVMTRPRLIGDVVREYLKHGRGRRTVAFAVSIDHSRALEAEFTRAGVRAKHLDGHAKEKARRASLQALVDQEIDVLCNVNLFTEGWDCPAVSCVIMARPTVSVSLYLQSVGRGLRPCSGKDDLLILDHAGNIARHGYPDDTREWSLESAAQSAKRLAEIKELNRVYRLGFDSIEAELEEKRRIETELKRSLSGRWSTAEAASFLGIRGRSGVKWLRRRGVHPLLTKLGKKGGCFYDPVEVRAAALSDPETYSAQECARIFNKRTHLADFLKRNGISPASGRATSCRYAKSLVDALVSRRTVLVSSAG